VKQYKKYDFYLGGGFHKFLMMGQSNESLQKIKIKIKNCALGYTTIN